MSHYESLKKFLKVPNPLVNTNNLTKQTLSLPINQFLNLNQVEYVCKAINDFYKKNI
mgnify:CR=1 FL=1